MSDRRKGRHKGPAAIGALVGRVIDPVVARRGFANADLVAAWPEIAGPLYAGCTAPERIAWPRRGDSDEPGAGVLFLKVDGPRAVLVQHELPAIIARINAYFGYRAIGQARITQAPVPAPTSDKRREKEPAKQEPRLLHEAVAGIDDKALRDSLARLGGGVWRTRRK